MKFAFVVFALAASAVAAGYYGFAQQMAEGFMVLAILFTGLFVLSSVAGGVRVSGPRPATPRLVPKVRRHTA